MRYRQPVIFLLLVCAVAITQPAWPQNAPQPPDAIAYDVSFYIDRSHPDGQPAPPVAALNPDEPIGGDPLPSRSQAKESLIKIIRETIDPTSWQTDHIPPAAIAFHDDKLVIVQSADNQLGIKNLLTQLKGDGSEKLQAAFDTHRAEKTHFENAPLAQAIKEVATAAKIAIEIDWRSFQPANIIADAPTSVDLTHATTAQAIRAIFNSAAGHEIGLRIEATPKAIGVTLDNLPPEEQITRVYNVQAIRARACGLDVKTPFTRAQALAAITNRVKDEVLHTDRIREIDGQIVVSGNAGVLRDISTFLDEIDAKAISEAAGAKQGEKKTP